MNGMENNPPLLSIYIPTYNRPEKIQIQVRRLLPQLSSRVVLYVIDNHSDQPVCDLFSDEEREYVNIIRNDINVGGDANIARCFEYCSTKLLWVLGDDDPVVENAVDVIFDTYFSQGDSVFYYNFGRPYDAVTTGFDEFCLKHTTRAEFSSSFMMSKCVYNISLFKSDVMIYYKYVSCMIGTLITVLKCLEYDDKKKCLFSSRSLIVYNDQDIHWSIEDYIIKTQLIFDIFKKKEYRMLQRTLFKPLGEVYISHLFTLCRNKKISCFTFFHLFRIVRCRLGCFRLFTKYLPSILNEVFKMIFPSSFYEVVKRKAMKYKMFN